MKTAIIIPSTGRAEILGKTLERLVRQLKAASQVLVVVVEQLDLPEKIPDFVTVVFAEKGSTTQRNAGIERVMSDVDLLLFIDDDTFLHRNYIEMLEKIFEDHEDLIGVSGQVVRNGDVTIDEADEILNAISATDIVTPIEIVDSGGLYGCNMAVRKSLMGDVRFDERFVLYGWLEDADFAFNLKIYGRVCRSMALKCVHLMYSTGGRSNHVRFGFSQVMNPLYLSLKHRQSIMKMMREHWLKGVPKNILCSVFGPNRVDRFNRLKGNLIAFSLILCGRIQPEFAVKL